MIITTYIKTIKLTKFLSFVANSRWVVIFIMFLGITLRFVGIWWNLPKIYHPDEPALISGGLGLRLVSNLRHFDWPHMQMYISLIAISLWAKVTDIYTVIFNVPISNAQSLLLERPASFYLVVRFVSFSMASLSLAVFYKGVKEFLGRRIAIVSLLFFALSVQNVEDAHFATLESGLTFWVVLSFFFCQRLARDGKLINYFLSGAFAGFSASTKYNGALVVILIFMSHIVYSVNSKKQFLHVFLSKNLFVAAISSVVGFFVGTPYALLDFSHFIRTDSAVGALWQFKRQKSPIAKTLLNFELLESRFKSEFVKSLGFFGTHLSLLGVYFTLKNFKKVRLFLIIFPALYFWYIGSLKLFYSQYLNPLFPFISILCAVGLMGFVKSVFSFHVDLRIKYLLGFIAVVVVFLSQISNLIRMNYVFATGDTRKQAEKWVEENVRPGSKILISGAYSVKLEDFDGDFGYNASFVDDIFRNLDQNIGHDAQLDYFRNMDYRIFITGDFDLDKRLVSKYPFYCKYPDGDSFVIDSLQKIKVFPARSFIEPTIAIMSTDSAKTLLDLGILTPSQKSVILSNLD